MHAVAYYLGQTARVLGRSDANDHFERAIDLHQQANAPFGAALAHAALADLIDATAKDGAIPHGPTPHGSKPSPPGRFAAK